MTQIDFYILGQNSTTAALFACRLADKVYHMSHSIYIHAESKEQAEQLDDLLWTFNQGSFLPHEIRGRKPVTSPIVIGYNDDPQIHSDVMINLSDKIPLFFSQFNRVAEIVCGDNAARQLARQNYKFYKDRGYNLHTHEIAL